MTQATPCPAIDVDDDSLPLSADGAGRARCHPFISRRDGQSDWFVLEQPASPATTDWVVVLHGHGSTGDQLYTRPDLRDAWLPDLRGRGVGILCPNTRGNGWMGPACAADLHALLAWVRRRHRARRFFLLGGSMGGTGVLIYSVLHPQDVAGAAALCPATDIATYFGWCAAHAHTHPTLPLLHQAIAAAYAPGPAAHPHHRVRQQAARLTMPLALAHGDADPLIPCDESRQLVAAIHQLGQAPLLRYIEQPGGGHDAPLALQSEALDWAMGVTSRPGSS